MAPRAIIPGWTWLTSLAVHGALIGGFGWLAFRTLEPAPPEATQATVPSPDRAAPVDLPAFTQDVTLLSDNAADPVGALPTHAGGTQVARVDTGHDGRGGQATVDERAVHLSDVDERMHRVDVGGQEECRLRLPHRDDPFGRKRTQCRSVSRFA